MINIYWPVYKNLERQFNELMFDIHIDDQQVNVYSLKISDLILRAAVEIESISKDLYSLNGGVSKTHLKYDEDAIQYLNKIWLLEMKVVIISSTNCFLTNRIIYPFHKKEKRTGSERQTYSWNNSYQNLKHNRGNSLTFASIKYLFDIMAALYVLNIYYKDESFDIARDSQSTSFPVNLGSDIFSISLHKWFSYDGQFNYGKKENFDECIYLTKMTDNSIEESKKVNKESHEKMAELFSHHPKYLKYIQENDITNYKGHNLMWDVLGQQDYTIITNQSMAATNFNKVQNRVKYEGILNKNQL